VAALLMASPSGRMGSRAAGREAGADCSWHLPLAAWVPVPPGVRRELLCFRLSEQQLLSIHTKVRGPRAPPLMPHRVSHAHLC
jgi:hypothetical protein